MRQYSYQISYLDKGRYQRIVNGVILATSLRASMGRAVAEGKKKAKGWRETCGAEFIISILVGPNTASKEVKR